jgi:putative peptide zinc metalloprotease protein
MLCPCCHRQIERAAELCGSCGTPLAGHSVPFGLVLNDGTHVPITDTVTIGRAPGNTIRLTEPSVSRNHARIFLYSGAPEIEDAGSSYGTFVDDRRVSGRERLRDGARIKLGDAELLVEAQRPAAASGRTIVVPLGASLVVPAVGQSEIATPSGSYGLHPRLRAGWALKRLEAGDDERRYVLKDLRGGSFARMTESDVELFRLLDGENSLQDLIIEANHRFGPGGASRVASLLADLGERGLLEGVEQREPTAATRPLRRLLRSRNLVVHWAGDAFELMYSRGGFVLFTRPAIVLVTTLALGGAAAFAYLIAGGHGTPFVVASRVGIGGLVFLIGRFLVVLSHEVAHGLTVVSFGRRVPRAGLKLVLVFPYAFVDTSEAWFEPRRRRLAISAAGPVSDLTIGGVAALTELGLAHGVARDVVFQLALAAYIGAFFNLNPLLERDGYHMLVDLLREPGLRRRSQAWIVAALKGNPSPAESDPHVLGVYAAAALAWSLLMASFTVLISLRYYGRLVALAPRAIVWLLFGAVYLAVLVPILAVVFPAARRRSAEPATRVDVAA